MLPSHQTTEYITCPYTTCAHPMYYTSLVIILFFIIAYCIEHSFLYSVPTIYLSRSIQTLRALAATSHKGGSKLWIFSHHLPITHPSAGSPLLVHHLSLSPPTYSLASFHKWPWLYPPATPHLARAAHLPHPSPKRARLWGVHWHCTDWRLLGCTPSIHFQTV